MQKEWKDDIVADERLGKRGWESIYNTWKAARVSKMMRDIDDERKKAVDGEGLQKAGATLMKILRPQI